MKKIKVKSISDKGRLVKDKVYLVSSETAEILIKIKLVAKLTD